MKLRIDDTRWYSTGAIDLRDYFPRMPEGCMIMSYSSKPHSVIHYRTITTMYDTQDMQSTERWCRLIGLSPEEIVVWILKFGHTLPSFYGDLTK